MEHRRKQPRALPEACFYRCIYAHVLGVGSKGQLVLVEFS